MVFCIVFTIWMLVDQNNSRSLITESTLFDIVMSFGIWNVINMFLMTMMEVFLKTHGQVSESVYKQFECP